MDKISDHPRMEGVASRIDRCQVTWSAVEQISRCSPWHRSAWSKCEPLPAEEETAETTAVERDAPRWHVEGWERFPKPQIHIAFDRSLTWDFELYWISGWNHSRPYKQPHTKKSKTKWYKTPSSLSPVCPFQAGLIDPWATEATILDLPRNELTWQKARRAATLVWNLSPTFGTYV